MKCPVFKPKNKTKHISWLITHPPSQTRVQQTVLGGIDALGKVALLLVARVAETVVGGVIAPTRHRHAERIVVREALDGGLGGGMGYEALHGG